MAFFTISPGNVLASTTYDWDLNTSSEYTYNANDIQFTGGAAQPSREHYATDKAIYGTYCFDSNICLFVGAEGTIVKTEDGGTTFVKKGEGLTTDDLNSISCTSSTTCYAVGGYWYLRSVILKTEDGGDTWIPQTSANTYEMNGISCIWGTNVCYAAGWTRAQKTIDGGLNWTALTNPSDWTAVDIHCTDSITCFVVAGSEVRRTTNGGTSWNLVLNSWPVFSIHCADSNVCYAVGLSGKIYKTPNGGANWELQTSGTTRNLRDVYCINSQNCYVVGDYGTILKKTDDGLWSSQTPPLLADFYSVFSLSASNSYTAGLYGTPYAAIVKTTNGNDWTSLHYYPTNPTVASNISLAYTRLAGFTETLGAGSTGTVYYQVSNNNGATWYYLNGSNVWTATSSDNNRNTAAQINSYIPLFTGDYSSGTGQFKWKAIFYATSGTQQQKLDNVQVTVQESPNAPQSLEITDVSDRSKEIWAVALNWDAPLVGGEINYYKIERSDSGGPWTEVGTTADETRRAYAEIVSSSSVTYSYRVRAVDDIGGVYQDESDPSNIVSLIPTGKYTMQPSLVGSPSVSVGATTTTITWSTDRISSSLVSYGTNTSYGSFTGGSQTNVTSHSVILRGLNPGTTYHYKIQSLDSERTYGDDIYYPSDYTFTTTQAAEISGLKIADVRSDSALLSWQTTSDMGSTVHYGETTEYGRTIDSGGGVNHVMSLTGLQDGTTYHLKIVGNDPSGNPVQSDDYSFETLGLPKISNIKFEQIKDRPTSTLKATWDTNVPASSTVEYTDSGGIKQATSDYQLLTKHETVISGLRDKTDYFITVKGRDGFGNEASSESHKITTDLDKRPPEISEITTEKSIIGYGETAKAQLIVTWTTDEPATSQVEYSESGSKKRLPMVTHEDVSMTTSHAVVITDLKPSTSYYFRIITKDKSNNETRSEVNSALTGQARLSIFDVIVKSFEVTFGWLFGGVE